MHTYPKLQGFLQKLASFVKNVSKVTLFKKIGSKDMSWDISKLFFFKSEWHVSKTKQLRNVLRPNFLSDTKYVVSSI